MHSVKMMICGVAIAALLTACGSSGGAGGSSATDAQVASAPMSAAGVWTGKDGNNGLRVQIVVAESGEFTVSQVNGVIYVGKLSMSGSSFNGTFEAYTTQLATPFFDGSTHATGSISGSAQAQAVLKAQIGLTTDLGADSSDVVQLSFAPASGADSTLATLAGNYTDEGSGTVYSLDANGALFGQSATTGCVLNGQVSATGTGANVYSVTTSVASCTGPAQSQNGTFSGLLTLDSSTNPAQLALIAGDISAKTGQILTLSAN